MFKGTFILKTISHHFSIFSFRLSFGTNMWETYSLKTLYKKVKFWQLLGVGWVPDNIWKILYTENDLWPHRKKITGSYFLPISSDIFKSLTYHSHIFGTSSRCPRISVRDQQIFYWGIPFLALEYILGCLKDVLSVTCKTSSSDWLGTGGFVSQFHRLSNRHSLNFD